MRHDKKLIPTSKIALLRRGLNMTQKQLADAAGVNIRLIQKVEYGEAKASNLTAKNLLAIAKSLNVSPYDLI